jgi:hypothetical protein
VFATRFERAERLRVSVDSDAPAGAAGLAELAQGDAGAVQSAWVAFVPLLAHPVMNASATRAMAVLDAAGTLLSSRAPAAA